MINFFTAFEGIIRYIQKFSNPTLDKVFTGITITGEGAFIIAVVSLIFWCISKEAGYRMGFTLISGNAFNEIIKGIFMVKRPIGEPGIRSLRVETAPGYSFPSGHTQGTAEFWVSLMKFRRRIVYFIVGIIMIVLVGISRMYLGLHRPVDVLGGLVIGVLWVFICNFIFDYCEYKGNRIYFIVMLLPLIICMLIFKNNEYYKTMGALVGFFIGYMFEPYLIDFKTSAPLSKQFLKILMGYAGIAAVEVVSSKLLPSGLAVSFLSNMIITLWIALGVPAIFMKFFGIKRGIF